MILCPTHGVQPVRSVCPHAASSFHAKAPLPETTTIRAGLIVPRDAQLSLCSTCSDEEGLDVRDQDFEGDEGYERFADIFDRRGTFLCGKCWQERGA